MCFGNTENKVAIGLAQPQLDGYDSYVHNQLVGVGNAHVNYVDFPNDDSIDILDRGRNSYNYRCHRDLCYLARVSTCPY